MSPWRNHVIHSKEATVDRRDQLSRKTWEVSETGQSRSNKRHRPHHQTRKFPFYILWVTSRTLCHSDPSHVWQQYGEVIICSVYNWDEGGDSWKAIVLTEGGTEGGSERVTCQVSESSVNGIERRQEAQKGASVSSEETRRLRPCWVDDCDIKMGGTISQESIEGTGSGSRADSVTWVDSVTLLTLNAPKLLTL